MDKVYRSLFLFLSYFLCITSLMAKPRDEFFRDFWQPKYHGLRLNYCTLEGKECGLAVATRYCQMMGYNKASHQVKANNVGLTQYLSMPIKCVGWQCNGFKTIRCLGLMTHKPAKNYHYRLHHFVYPRYKNYRVDWCYDGEHFCGKRAAHSFCRRMGYMTARRFYLEEHLAATQAIGNEKLCFGNHCRGFTQIDCYR